MQICISKQAHTGAFHFPAEELILSEGMFSHLGMPVQLWTQRKFSLAAAGKEGAWGEATWKCLGPWLVLWKLAERWGCLKEYWLWLKIPLCLYLKYCCKNQEYLPRPNPSAVVKKYQKVQQATRPQLHPSEQKKAVQPAKGWSLRVMSVVLERWESLQTQANLSVTAPWIAYIVHLLYMTRHPRDCWVHSLECVNRLLAAIKLQS